MDTSLPCSQWQPSLSPPQLQLSLSPSQSQPSLTAFDTPASTPPPPSLAKSSKPDRVRRPKLRASCDACAASKVKCSKDHPVCQRCATNNSSCVYGVSRKHGKPGRVRKRNADGTLFVKAKKGGWNDGREFGKFKVRIEDKVTVPVPVLEFDATSSLRSTPEWGAEMTPDPFEMGGIEPMYVDGMGFPFMEEYPETGFQMDAFQPEFSFRDPFAKKQSAQLDLPDIQALKDYIGGDSINPFDCTFQEVGLGISLDGLSTSEPSPKSMGFDREPGRLSISVAMPTSHCCSALAHSTLESLRVTGPDSTQPWPNVETKTLDSVLSTTKLAVQSVSQLLSCPCSSDPHLAMLYASITWQILSWYQLAAGVNPAPLPLSSPSSASSSVYSSPLSTPGSEHAAFSIQMQPLRFGAYHFDEAQQEQLRRQVVLKELSKCGQLVEALAGWRGGDSEQAEFLYGMLGTWLRGELDRTVGEVERL